MLSRHRGAGQAIYLCRGREGCGRNDAASAAAEEELYIRLGRLRARPATVLRVMTDVVTTMSRWRML